MKESFVLRLEGVSGAEASIEAQRLREVVLDAAPGVEASVHREHTETMDAGAALLVLLSGPAVVAVAKGIAGFIGKRGARGGELVVERRRADGSTEVVRFSGDSVDAAKVAEALRPAASAAGQA
jgi:hypothetical protein